MNLYLLSVLSIYLAPNQRDQNGLFLKDVGYKIVSTKIAQLIGPIGGYCEKWHLPTKSDVAIMGTI